VKNSVLLMAVVAVILLGGCSLYKDLKQTASENMEIDKTLPTYKLNMENFKEISYEGKTYVIQEAEVTKEDLDEPIGKVAETITLNENHEILSKQELKKIEVFPKGKDEKRTYLNYGWVYRIKNVSSNEKVAVVINNQFCVAKIKSVDE